MDLVLGLPAGFVRLLLTRYLQIRLKQMVAADELDVERVADEIMRKDVAAKAAADMVIADKAEADKVAADELDAERVADDIRRKDLAAKAVADKVIADKAAADKVVDENVAPEKVAEDNVANDKVVPVKEVAEEIPPENVITETEEAAKKAGDGEESVADAFAKKARRKAKKAEKQSAKKLKLQELSSGSDLDTDNNSEDETEPSLATSKAGLSSEGSDTGTSKEGGSWSLGSHIRPILPSDRSRSSAHQILLWRFHLENTKFLLV